MALKVIVFTAVLHAFVSGSAGQTIADSSESGAGQSPTSAALTNNFVISPRFPSQNANVVSPTATVPVTVPPPGSPNLLQALISARDNILQGTDVHPVGGLAGLISGAPVVTAAPIPDPGAPTVLPTLPVVIPSETINIIPSVLPQIQAPVPQGRADDRLSVPAFQPRRSPLQPRLSFPNFTVPPPGSPNLLEALSNVRDDIFQNNDIHPVGGLAGLVSGDPAVTAATVSETNG